MLGLGRQVTQLQYQSEKTGPCYQQCQLIYSLKYILPWLLSVVQLSPPKTPGPWKAFQLQWQSTKYSQAGILHVKIWVRFQKRDLANNGWGSRMLHKCQLLLCSILPGFCYSYIGTIAAARQGLSESGLWSPSAKDSTQHVRENISMPLWNKLIHYINLIKK